MVFRTADSALVRCRQPAQGAGRAKRWRCGVGPRGRREGLAEVATTLPVSQWGVAGDRPVAVFCQMKPARSPRLIAFNECGHSILPSGSRRERDMKHER